MKNTPTANRFYTGACSRSPLSLVCGVTDQGGVLIFQCDYLNEANHPSTMICPITTQVNLSSEILRVQLSVNIGKLEKKFDVLIDQIRAIDNQRLKEKIGDLPPDIADKVKENIRILLDLE